MCHFYKHWHRLTDLLSLWGTNIPVDIYLHMKRLGNLIRLWYFPINIEIISMLQNIKILKITLFHRSRFLQAMFDSCKTVSFFFIICEIICKSGRDVTIKDSHRRCSLKKAVLKNFAIFTRKQLC